MKSYATPDGKRYVDYRLERDVYRDVWTLEARPRDSGAAVWRCEIVGLLMKRLTPLPIAPTVLETFYKIAANLAESGGTPADLIPLLERAADKLDQATARVNHLVQPILQQHQMNPGVIQQYAQQYGQGWDVVGQGARPSEMWEQPQRVTQEIIAYRSWLFGTTLELSPRGTWDPAFYLYSLHNEARWDGPVFRSNQPPAEGTGYGVHAIGIEARHAGNWDKYVAVGLVWGEVALSGLVAEGVNGYRAEVCTIRRLWIGGVGRPLVRMAPELMRQALEDRYQCEAGEAPATLRNGRNFYQQTRQARDMADPARNYPPLGF